MKVFTTGVYGSGKTFLANQIAKKNQIEFISFDEHVNYRSNNDQFDWLMSIVPESFVMDAIPFDSNFTWSKFIDYQKEETCQIICCYCPDLEIWMTRVREKEISVPIKVRIVRRIRIIRKVGRIAPLQALNSTIQSCWHFIKTRIFKIMNFQKEVDVNLSKDSISEHHLEYYRFILERFPQLIKMENVQWFDSIENEYTTLEETMNRIDLNSIKEIIKDDLLKDRLFDNTSI